MDIAGLLPWFDDRPGTTHDDLSQLLIDLWLKDAAAGRSVASLPWVADGLGRWDKIVLRGLPGIASADIDSGTFLDAESEAMIHASLKKLMAGRSTLVIAHRLSTVRDADKIVVLDAGRVEEQGGHAELLGLGGIYAKLVAAQISSAKS